MVHRLPEHVLTQLLIRLKVNEPVRKIHADLGIARSTIYTIIDNLDMWGIPYPPPTVTLGRERLLAKCHVQVHERPC